VEDVPTDRGQAADVGAVTRAEVDVDRSEGRGPLRQSSTVDPALVLAFDEVHVDQVYRAFRGGPP